MSWPIFFGILGIWLLLIVLACVFVRGASLASGFKPDEDEKKFDQAKTPESAGQSRKHSLIESLINIAVGYGIALASQLLIFPQFGIHISLQDNIVIGLLFTVVSIARSYALRRLFNRWHQAQQSHG